LAIETEPFRIAYYTDRVYYAIDAGTIVLLLCGGDKQTQQLDIETSQRFLKSHQEQQK